MVYITLTLHVFQQQLFTSIQVLYKYDVHWYGLCLRSSCFRQPVPVSTLCCLLIQHVLNIWHNCYGQ